MQRAWLGVLVSASLAFVGCESQSDSAAPSEVSSGKPTVYDNGHALSIPTTDPLVTSFESELLTLVNSHRAAHGLNVLVDSGRIGDGARAHATHMIEHRFFAHACPEGFTPGERLAMAGVDWMAVGENIAAGQGTTPQAIFEAWMASPLHRAKIESELYTHAGAGYAFDTTPTPEFPDGDYWVLLFVRR